MLPEPIAEGLWSVNGHFQTPLFRGSVRMTVLAGDEGLVLYSPVALAPEAIARIAELGPVRAILAPNLYHYRFLRQAAEAFPQARVFVPAALEARSGPIPRAETMTRDRPPALPGGIDHLIVERHAIRETVLFHRPSRSLVTADLLYNYQSEHGAGEKAFFRLLGCYGAPGVVFYHRFAIRDKAAVRELVEQVRTWNPQRIVIGHGRIIEDSTAAELFAAAWRRFG